MCHISITFITFLITLVYAAWRYIATVSLIVFRAFSLLPCILVGCWIDSQNYLTFMLLYFLDGSVCKEQKRDVIDRHRSIRLHTCYVWLLPASEVALTIFLLESTRSHAVPSCFSSAWWYQTHTTHKWSTLWTLAKRGHDRVHKGTTMIAEPPLGHCLKL